MRFRSKRNWSKFYGRWRAQWPSIAANVTTAFILFIASLTFSPVRNWFFPDDAVSYPLICTADPVPGRLPDETGVEFFIVNRTKDELAREDLLKSLRQVSDEADLSPDIILERKWGRIKSATADVQFNGDKAELDVLHDEEKATIRVRRLDSRAIVRVLIVVSDSGLPLAERSIKVAIPLEYAQYQDACYRR